MSKEFRVWREKLILGNSRGVALLIVLLVTSLLIALVFEFAYGTRISLRAAVNFRDSQRAYYLARSGVSIFGNFRQLQDYIPQRQWSVIPFVSQGDTEIRLWWEDENGKINITNLTKNSMGYNRLGLLFELRGIDRDILDRISAWMIAEQRSFYLITELHQFLSDEDFDKVQDAVTTATGLQTKININSAPADVLQSVGVSSGMAAMIVDRVVNRNEPFKTDTEINDFLGPANANVSGQLTTATSTVFKVISRATVGGYIKQVDAIITRNAGVGYALTYWRAL